MLCFVVFVVYFSAILSSMMMMKMNSRPIQVTLIDLRLTHTPDEEEEDEAQMMMEDSDKDRKGYNKESQALFS